MGTPFRRTGAAPRRRICSSQHGLALVLLLLAGPGCFGEPVVRSLTSDDDVLGGELPVDSKQLVFVLQAGAQPLLFRVPFTPIFGSSVEVSVVRSSAPFQLAMAAERLSGGDDGPWFNAEAGLAPKLFLEGDALELGLRASSETDAVVELELFLRNDDGSSATFGDVEPIR